MQNTSQTNKSTMKTVYAFGNEYVKEDGFAKEVASELKGNFHVITAATPDVLFENKEKEILIIDVVRNIKKPMLITDLSQLKTRNIVSLHDFDLGYVLTLLRNLGRKNKILIIGVPPTGNKKHIASEVEKMIK